MVTGVWFGNDDDSPMKGVTGGTAPAKLWADFMVQAHKDMPIKELANISDDDIYITEEKLKESRKTKKKENLFERIIDNFLLD